MPSGSKGPTSWTQKDCVITITHNIVIKDLGGHTPEQLKDILAQINEGLDDIFHRPELKFCCCSVKFEFTVVMWPAPQQGTWDRKMLLAGNGRDSQSKIGPGGTGSWYPDDPGWHGGTAAHEVAHELGMKDKYEDYEENGKTYSKPIPGYPEDGLAANDWGELKPVDIKDIMDNLGITCPEECCEDELIIDFEEGGLEPDATDTGLLGSGGMDSVDKEILEDLTKGEDGDDPRDVPPPTIFGEELDLEIKRPVIFVPGFMGSKLYKKKSRRITNLVWPPYLPNSLRKLSMNNILYPKGVVGEYEPLLQFLRSLGYKDGETLFVFAYDWRISNRQNGNSFISFINAKLKEGGNKYDSVDVICHSMGGLITRYARKSGAPIKKSIYLASPHYGSHKAYMMLHPMLADYTAKTFIDDVAGSKLKKHYLSWVSSGLGNPSDQLKKFVKDFPSLYELLPDMFYFKNQPLVNGIRDFAQTYYQKNPTGPWQFPKTQLYQVYRGMVFKAYLGKDLPGTPNLVIYSDSVKTHDWIKIKPPYNPPKFVLHRLADGDKTVGKKSGMLSGGNPNGQIKKVSGEHTGLVATTETHQLIGKFLKDGTV